MGRKLIIDGNAVYEIDEECMLKNRVDINEYNIGDGEKKSEKKGYRNRKRQQNERER